MKETGYVKTKCPFYERESKFSITCEGTDESNRVSIKFNSEREKIEHQAKECYRYPNECEIAKMCKKKYADT